MEYDEARKTFGGILDDNTLYNLYQLARKLHIDKFYGVIKSGKESSVILAESKEIIAIKIFSLNPGKFDTIRKYIMGDERFRKVKPERRSLVFAWCKKEFSNLYLARAAKVNCPRPITFRQNILIMEFIGDGTEPAPRLVDVELENPEDIIKQIVSEMKKLYKARLVHGDLSPYNILLKDDMPVIIDFSQAVLLSHPLAAELLERDIVNIINYAGKHGIKLNKEEMYKDLKA